MAKEFEHLDDDVIPGAVEPTTRDDTTAPGGFQFLMFHGKFLTFHDKKMMKAESDG